MWRHLSVLPLHAIHRAVPLSTAALWRLVAPGGLPLWRLRWLDHASVTEVMLQGVINMVDAFGNVTFVFPVILSLVVRKMKATVIDVALVEALIFACS